MILTNEDYQDADYRLSRPLGEIMQERAIQLDERRKEPDKWKPIPTHLPDLNKVIGGLPVEQPFYLLVTSELKIGKTTIGMDLADAWKQGAKNPDGSPEPVIYAQLEELSVQYADRTIARLTSLTRNDIRLFSINDEQMKEIYEVSQEMTKIDNLYIQDDLFSIFALIKEAKRIGCKKIVLDNLQLVDQQGHKGLGSREKFEAISRYLVTLRNKEGFSFIVISQEGQSGKAFGSHQADRDADIRIKIDYVYESTEDEEERKVEGQRRLIVQEGRIGGTGVAYVTFDGNKNKIGPIVKKDINSNDFLEMVAAEGPNLRVEV